MKQTKRSSESPRKGTALVFVSQPVSWPAIEAEGIPLPRNFVASVGQGLNRVTVELWEQP